MQILEQRVADGGTLRIMRDITAIKQRELQFADLAQRNAVLASTVASVTSGVVICDATQHDQPIVFANAAFTRITGYTAAEAIGRNCRFLQGRDTDREQVERMRRAIAVGRAVTVTLRNYRKDGRTFWNEVNISPLHDASGRPRSISSASCRTRPTGSAPRRICGRRRTRPRSRTARSRSSWPMSATNCARR